MTCSLVFLHGFLGHPSDFAHIFEFVDHSPRFAPDLLQLAPPPSTPCHWDADVPNRWFHEWILNIRHTIENAFMTPSRPFLVGYSLGGRLAMHLITLDPSAYAGAVIISAHPGISDPDERKHRATNDDHWAYRWTSEPYTSVLRDWNCQPVFADRPDHRPPCAPNHLTTWAQVLRHASPGRTPSLWTHLPRWQLPLLWIAGEHDTKYSKLYATITGTVAIVPDSAHRVPWDNPDQFSTICQRFFVDVQHLQPDPNPVENVINAR